MAEALGAASAVITLTEAAVKLGQAVCDYKDAPYELLVVNNELSDLKLLAAQAKMLAENDPSASEVLERPLRQASVRIARLRDLLKQAQDMSKVDRVKWVGRLPKVRKMQSSLRDARLELAAAFALTSSNTGLRVEADMKTSLSQILSEVRDSREALTNLRSAQFSEVDVLRKLESGREESPPPGYATISKRGGVSEVTIQMRPPRPHVGLSQCHCACHQTSSFGLNLNRLLGGLFVSYHGVPYLTRCSKPWCCMKTTQSAGVSATYRFPSWFLQRAISLSLLSSQGQEVHFSIRVQNIVGYKSLWMQAALHGDDVAIKSLLASCPTRVHDVDQIGQDALQVALRKQHFSTMKLLIQAGADVLASQSSESALTRMFYRYCITTDQRAFWLECAAQYIHALIEETPEIHKIVLGFLHVDLSDYLKVRPHEVDIADSNGRTALWWAAARRHATSVCTLLRYNADVNAKDTNGDTVLHIACHGLHAGCATSEIVRMILDRHPMIVKRVGRYGNTILHEAAWLSDDPECRRMLIRYALNQGADPNARNAHGNTPLSYMAARNNELGGMIGVELLLDCGANIDSKDHSEATAIHHAIDYKRSRNLGRLLELRASYTEVDCNKRTILHYAASKPDVDVLQILHSHVLEGLDIFARDSEGDTAMDLFERHGMDTTAKVSSLFYDLIDKVQFARSIVEIAEADSASPGSVVSTSSSLVEYFDCL